MVGKIAVDCDDVDKSYELTGGLGVIAEVATLTGRRSLDIDEDAPAIVFSLTSGLRQLMADGSLSTHVLRRELLAIIDAYANNSFAKV